MRPDSWFYSMTNFDGLFNSEDSFLKQQYEFKGGVLVV